MAVGGEPSDASDQAPALGRQAHLRRRLRQWMWRSTPTSTSGQRTIARIVDPISLSVATFVK
jgi:short subunit dehydrogenase-like uncharacterized protein